MKRKVVRWIGGVIVGLTMVLIAACLHAARVAGVRSNIARLALTDHGIIDAASKQPYTGNLIAEGAEINAVATYLFAKTPWQRGAADAKFAGFVLVLPVKQGVVDGHAERAEPNGENRRSNL